MNESKLDLLALQWKEIADRTERENFYQQQVFPEISQTVVAREQAKIEQSYTHLILPVGLSPEPIILSIRIFNPQKVYLLYTSASEKFLDRIVKESSLRISQVDKDEIDETNVPAIYQSVKAIYQKWGKPGALAIDISGGKKSMVGGCALAGAVLGARLFYIDSIFNQELRKPEPGSEHLALLENPYVVFGDLKLTRAIELFRQLDFVSAEQLFEELRLETASPQLYEARKLLCKAYRAWDDWDIQAASKALSEVISVVTRYAQLDRNTPLAGQLPVLREQENILRKLEHAHAVLGDVGNDEIHLQNPDVFIPMLGSLKEGALRQEKRGKLDVAALLWYRLLEFMSQQRLSVHQISTGNPDYSKLTINHDELLKKYQAAIVKDKNKSPDSSDSLPSPIDLMKGYRLLIALGDKLLPQAQLGALRGKVSVRDKSQFAHGYKPIGERDYEDFKKFVVGILEKFLEISDLPASSLDYFRFIELP